MSNNPSTAGSPRVVHCLPNLALGGAQRAVIELLDALSRRGIDQRLLVIGHPCVSIEWSALRTKPVYLNYNGSMRDPRGFLRATNEVRRYVRDHAIDIVHSHLWEAAMVIGQGLRGGQTRHIAHVHDTRPWLTHNGIRHRIRRWSMRRLLTTPRTEFIAVSQDAWEYNSLAMGITDVPHYVLQNGVNLKEFIPQVITSHERSPYRIGLAARFSPEKGQRLLVQSAKDLLDRNYEVELHLAGSGSRELPCRELAHRLGIADRVTFHGTISDVAAFLATLDIFVLPSLGCEGLPLSILEAMATRIPVVATDIGGTRELVKHQENGLLVAPDDQSGLTAALATLCDDVSLRQKLADAGYATVHEKHSWDSVAGDIASIYRTGLR